MGETMPTFGAGILLAQLISLKGEPSNQYLLDDLDECHFHVAGIEVAAGSFQLHFDPQSPGSGYYTRGREKGRVDTVIDLDAPGCSEWRPEQVKRFEYKFQVVIVSETPKAGVKQIW